MKKMLHRVKKERNVLLTIQRKKVKWINDISSRNSVLKCVVETKVECTRRRARWRKKLLADVKGIEGIGI
jgi:hypothetical protein